MKKQKPVVKEPRLLEFLMPKSFVADPSSKNVERALALILRVVEGLNRSKSLFSTNPGSAFKLNIGVTESEVVTSGFLGYLYNFNPEIEVKGFEIEEKVAGRGLGKPKLVAVAEALGAEADDEVRRIVEQVKADKKANLEKAVRGEALLADMIKAAKAGKKADLVNILMAIGKEIGWNSEIKAQAMADVIDDMRLGLRVIISMKSDKVKGIRPILKSWRKSLGSAKKGLRSNEYYGWQGGPSVRVKRSLLTVTNQMDLGAVADFLVEQSKE